MKNQIWQKINEDKLDRASNEKNFGNPDLLNLNKKKKKKMLSSMLKWDDESIVVTNKGSAI